ncbi:MAG: hypothetical protein VKS61_10005 [Candidatus Sericytochromatia bacterium]|nr:hypothetical protein [Candidatus Sericytochromatia bacterium]
MKRIAYAAIASVMVFTPLAILWQADRTSGTSTQPGTAAHSHYAHHHHTYYYGGGHGGWFGNSYGWGSGDYYYDRSGGASARRGGGPGMGGK